MRVKRKTRKKSGSSQREKPRDANGKSMNARATTPDPELEALNRLRDEDIDTSDIPEITDGTKAIVGKFYRPIKSSVTIRLDADVLAWLKRSGPGYQTFGGCLFCFFHTFPQSHQTVSIPPTPSNP
jgi:uncharacterized protein (DUF4415 family)